MKLKDIITRLEYINAKEKEKLCQELSPSSYELEVENIAYDSRKSSPHSIFVAIPGETVDGHSFAKSAYAKGCRIFIVEKEVDLPNDSFIIKVKNSRKALSVISSEFFKNPSNELTIIGVTGTKGKTTVTNWMSGILSELNVKTGIIGTNGIFYNGKTEKTNNTTPESFELHRILRNMSDNGVTHVFMEVSSSGIMMHRTDDINFDVAVFTNLAPDHIGPKEHKTFEDYRDCKTRLFLQADTAIINIDDKASGFFTAAAEKHGAKIVTFGINNAANFKCENIVSCENLSVQFDCKRSSSASSDVNSDQLLEQSNSLITGISVPSPGIFSIYNALSVIATLVELGFSTEKVIKALKDVKVAGRMEILDIIPGIPLVLDYAHNRVSMNSLLETLTAHHTGGKIICVFGSIGTRAIMRRKELGEVVSQYADVGIITTDNPDTEDPEKIISDIEKSMDRKQCIVYKEPDRKKAIELAIDMATPGDLVVLAGKGHEKYQIINGQKIHFDEKQIAVSAANKKAAEM